MAGANIAARGSVAAEVDTLWLDVSALVLLPHKYTSGIPRTIRKISQVWAANPWTKMRFCVLVPDYGLVEVNPEALRKILGLDRSTDSTDADKPFTKKPKPAPEEPQRPRRVGSRLWFLPMPIRRRVRTTIRGFKHWLFKTPLPFPPYPPGYLSREVRLGPRDLLFSLGGLWMVPNIKYALTRVKHEQHFQFVSLIYDLIPIFATHFSEPRLLQAFVETTQTQLAESNLLLTISKYSRQDIQRHAREQGISIAPVEVFTLGSDIRPSEVDAQPLHTRPFVLSVGTIEARKNHAGMYQAWRRLVSELGPERAPDLVLAGNIGWEGEEVVDSIQADPLVRDKIIIKENPNDRQLDWLYKNCLFTIYPSLYEGWGLPVEESLIYGKLCVTTTASSLPEVGRQFADYVAPGDIAGLVEGVKKALDPEHRARRERLIRDHFCPNTWEDAAHMLEGLLKSYFQLPEVPSEIPTPAKAA